MTTFLATVFVLGVLIFFHELGHFMVAKWAGIRVDKFSLGFPPAIFKKKWGETEYAIGIVPLGGYVKMAGENPDDEITGASYEFMGKSTGVRAAVVVAGPVMNFILAWLILWGLFFFQGEPHSPSVIGSVSPNSPAEMAGLKVGDRIVSVNGQAVSEFYDMAAIISRQVGKPIDLIWERDGEEMAATVVTRADSTFNEKGEKIPVGKIGVGQQIEYRNIGFFASVGRGFSKSVDFVAMVGEFVWNMLTMKISPKMIGGPVFIAKMAGETAAMGFSALLFFMALLSVNLAVLNVLPIPVLDGGHLLFLLIEKIKGSPLSMSQRMIAQQIGLVFLLIVIVWVSYNDIVRFING